MARKLLFGLLMLVALSSSCSANEKTPVAPQEVEVPEKLKLGYSVAAQSFTIEKLGYAKSVGIDYVEISGTNVFFDTQRNLKKTDEEIKSIFENIRYVQEETGVKVWSIHMAFSAHMDLSTIVEEDRQKIVNAHIQLLEYIKLVKPKYILFHPSYYLPAGQRDQRKSKLLKSLIELNEAVQAIGSTLVVENMLGPELMAGERERPLMRNVEECVEIMGHLPQNTGLAVDMCHIAHPEVLIKTLSDRLMTLHVSDGNGRAESHFMPCSGEGANDWNAILTALHEANYHGAFVYESAYEDEKDLVACYSALHADFVKTLKN